MILFHSAISFDPKKNFKFPSLLIKLWSLKKNKTFNIIKSLIFICSSVVVIGEVIGELLNVVPAILRWMEVKVKEQKSKIEPVLNRTKISKRLDATIVSLKIL